MKTALHMRRPSMTLAAWAYAQRFLAAAGPLREARSAFPFFGPFLPHGLPP